jgi:hypothetical protein
MSTEKHMAGLRPGSILIIPQATTAYSSDNWSQIHQSLRFRAPPICHHIPKQRHRVTNWRQYDAALRQLGSLTVWSTDEAIDAWRAQPRTTPGGQPDYSPLAIETALTLRAVFGLPLRQTERLISSIIRLLGLELSIPDHTTLCRRAETLQMFPRPSVGAGPVHLLVAVIVPPHSNAVPSETAGTEPTRRDLHLQFVAERGPRFAATPQQPPSRRPQRRPRQRHRRKPVLPPSAFAAMDARTCALRSLSNKRGSRSSRSAPEAFDALFCG